MTVRPRALAGVIFVAAGLATIVLASHRLAVPEQDRRAAAAMALFGQDDPDRVVAAGLHGLGGAPIPVQITQLGACRFRIAAGGVEDVVDFTQISSVRQRVIQDPVAGIVRGLAGKSGASGPKQLALTIFAGTDDAMCNTGHCPRSQIFALSDPRQSQLAQAVARQLVNACSGAGRLGLADKPPVPSR